LHPYLLEAAVAQHLAVCDAIERDAAGEAQIARAGLGGQRPGQPQYRLLGDRLDRGCEIHMDLLEPVFRSPRRNPEQRSKAVIRHAQPGAVIEVLLIKTKAAVILQIDQMVENGLGEARLAIGGEPHDLVFAGIDPKSGEIGERRIEQTEGMREFDLLQHRDPVSLAEPGRGRRPFADPVHRQNGGGVEGRWKKGRGGMAQMMFRKQ
jgi:hypothetical protein